MPLKSSIFTVSHGWSTLKVNQGRICRANLNTKLQFHRQGKLWSSVKVKTSHSTVFHRWYTLLYLTRKRKIGFVKEKKTMIKIIFNRWANNHKGEFLSSHSSYLNLVYKAVHVHVYTRMPKRSCVHYSLLLYLLILSWLLTGDWWSLFLPLGNYCTRQNPPWCGLGMWASSLTKFICWEMSARDIHRQMPAVFHLRNAYCICFRLASRKLRFLLNLIFINYPQTYCSGILIMKKALGFFFF